ncbi:MAG: excinuclease ABC subunit UvrC [Ignavibacteriaceae bacterium]|nr:excinuclease ABC subunit UvrC [Ignavibacteriaceae bacterium]
MNQTLESKLQNLPDSPGVYQYKNDKGKVIYVGKAVNLKNRVRSYFHSGVTSPKTIALVNKIEDLELIVTDNEVEALVLENNLIKEFRPRYNVNLKDDKSYPFIRVTKEPYPRIFSTRNVIRDGSKYFGPYTDVKNMKSSLRMLNHIFMIRSCKFNIDDEAIQKKKFRLCLEYHIKRCEGPCEGLISSADYNERVSSVIKVLRGKTDDLIKELKDKMNKAVELLEFEKAAEIRDKINQLQAISERQKVVSDDFEDRDIISIAYEGKDSACSVFNIRSGKLIAKKQLKLSIGEWDDPADIYSAAVRFYYSEFVDIPNEIALEILPSDAGALEEWLTEKARNEQPERKSKVEIVIPKRGSLSSLVKMCKENAIFQLKEIQIQKMKKEGRVSYGVSALQRDLYLTSLPRKIECFDISNLQGTDTVASMVVFEDGKPKKSLYRKFIIKDVIGPDDFSSMREVIKRRYSKLKEENGILPDLIMVDGGKGQLSSAVEILDNLGFKKYNVIGLAKRLEEVFFPGKSDPASIPKTSSGLKLLQQVRDEAHRFAITFHRNRRSKRTIQTELTAIEGIGPSTADILLKELGSVSAVKEAGIEQLEKLVGKKKAEIIIKYFSGTTQTSPSEESQTD